MSEIILTKQAAPTNPTAGKMAIYVNSAGTPMARDENGVETPLASGTNTFVAINVGGNTDITLSAAQLAFGLYEFNGALTGNINIIFSTETRSFHVDNITSGAFTLTCKTSAQVGGVVVPQSTTMSLYCNGSVIEDAGSSKEDVVNKDVSGGYVGKTLEKINAWNTARTFMSFFTNATTAVRTWTFPDKDGTVAMTSDITGTNSGTNTGDQTAATVPNTPAGSISATDVQAAINELDTEKEAVANKATTFGTVNDTLYPTVQAVKTYADSLVVGLLDDRGSYDASGNVFPSTGGSGAAGAILKGDLWYISVAGSLGGVVVAIGDSVRALVDTPGQTSTNWSVLESNIGFVPENSVNKDATGGYAGLTLFKINFKNALNTFTSFFTNSNTAARTYTFQDRDGTIADDTDLGGKAALAGSASQVFSVAPATAAAHAVRLDQIGGAEMQSGTFTATGTGFSTPPTTTATYKIMNGMCFINIPQLGISGTSNANTFTITGIPVAARPSATRFAGICLGIDNTATNSDLSVQIGTDGVITLGTGAGGFSGWTASGTKALYTTTIAYML